MKQALTASLTIAMFLIFGAVLLLKLDSWEKQVKAEVKQIVVETVHKALLERENKY